MKKKLLFLAAMPLVQATAAENNTEDGTLSGEQLQEVQVVATRANSRMPLAFKNLTKDDIKCVNYGQDIPAMLALTPSVTFTSDAGNGIGYTSIRVRGTDPSRINITANGVPMNDAESSQLFWVNFGDFASSAQSIQIQRGVGTSTNGAGAFGATVNMQTEGIGAEPYAGIDLSAGSYYSHKETLRFSTGLINGRWGLQGRLSNIGSKGYVDRASTKLNSYFLQAGYYGEDTQVKFITYNGQEETYHAWNYTSKYEQAQYGRSYNSCGEYYTADGRTLYYGDQTDNYHSQNYQLIWNQRLSSLWSMNAALHYTRGDGYYEEYKVGAGLKKYGLATNDAESDLVRRKQMGNDFYGAIASATYDNREGLSVIFGGGWNKYAGKHFGNVIWLKQAADVELTPDFEYYNTKARKTDFNLYGKVMYELTKGLNAFLDLQYRHIGYDLCDPTDTYIAQGERTEYIIKDQFDFFNPKFGLTYDITPNHRVYASYAIANKEPVRNNYKNNYLGGLDKPKAERLGDLEAGYKFQSEKFSAGLNIYYMSYKDQLVLTGEIDDIGEAITRNLDSSYRLGAELEAAWKPVDWFQWDINATWSRNRAKNVAITLDDNSSYTIDGETPLSFSPSLILNNSFTFKYKGMRIALQGQYTGDQYMTNTGFDTMQSYDDNNNPTWETLLLKKHFVANADISYTFSLRKCHLKDATVGITLYNIFNTEYDNNGWAAPSYTVENGTLKAYNYYKTRDLWAAGFAPSAPFNFMAHVSLNL